MKKHFATLIALLVIGSLLVGCAPAAAPTPTPAPAPTEAKPAEKPTEAKPAEQPTAAKPAEQPTATKPAEQPTPAPAPTEAKPAPAMAKISVSHQPCLHALPTYLAMQKGWDKEAGLEIDFQMYPSGAPQNEALASDQWMVGAEGSVPAMLAAIRYGAYIIAVSNDESETNDLWVRPDSPILKVKGYNPQYPEIYGSPETVKGATILLSTVSTGHYAVIATLRALGLNESDVKMVHMEQSQALAAFEAGQGDIIQLWAPYDYIAEAKGWVKMSSGRRAGAVIPGAVVASKKAVEEHPELVARWLALYMRGIREMINDPEGSAQVLKKYYTEECALDLSDQAIRNEFALRPLFNTPQQLALFAKDPVTGKSKVEQWWSDLADFFVAQGRIKPEDKEKLLTGGYFNDKILRMVAQMEAEQMDLPGAEPAEIHVSHQPCLHALPTYLAMQKGWDKEAGLKIDFQMYPSGAPQNEALASDQWQVGAEGSVPCMLAAIRYGASIIAVSNDESETNDLWVRPDSPILKVKGYNPQYPEIYGSPETVKGATILLSTVSTGHYAVIATLRALGLNESDVKMVHMEQSQALAAFEAGQGDIIQLWAPYDYIAEAKGWVKMSSGRRAGVVIPGGVVASKKAMESDPKLVARWLALYMRGIREMINDPEGSGQVLKKYYTEECALDLSDQAIRNEFALRPLFTTEQQLALYLKDPVTGKSKVEQWWSDLADFFVAQGRIKPEDKEKLLTGGYFNDKILEMVLYMEAKDGTLLK